MIKKSNLTKQYFHELNQSEIDTLISERKTVGYILKTYKQPDWCGYPNALEGQMGCWGLMDLSPDGGRTKVSENFCGSCELFSACKEK